MGDLQPAASNKPGDNIDLKAATPQPTTVGHPTRSRPHQMNYAKNNSARQVSLTIYS